MNDLILLAALLPCSFLISLSSSSERFIAPINALIGMIQLLLFLVTSEPEYFPQFTRRAGSHFFSSANYARQVFCFWVILWLKKDV